MDWGTVLHKISFISVRLKIGSYETRLNARKLADLGKLGKLRFESDLNFPTKGVSHSKV